MDTTRMSLSSLFVVSSGVRDVVGPSDLPFRATQWWLVLDRLIVPVYRTISKRSHGYRLFLEDLFRLNGQWGGGVSPLECSESLGSPPERLVPSTCRTFGSLLPSRPDPSGCGIVRRVEGSRV